MQQVSRRGDPDFLLCVHGKFVALELKRDNDTEPDRLQQHKLGLIEKAKGIALKVDPQNWNKVLGALQILAEGKIHDKIEI